MWYRTSNPYSRRAVIFGAILMVAFQFRGSLKVMEPVWSPWDEEETIINADPSLRAQNSIRKQTQQHLWEEVEMEEEEQETTSSDDLSTTTGPSLLSAANDTTSGPLTPLTNKDTSVNLLVPASADDVDVQPDASNFKATNMDADQDPSSNSSNTIGPLVKTTTTTTTTNSSQDESSESTQEEDTTSRKRRRKPLNVLILYPDDWRHDDIGGIAPVVRTPFLNELARDGIRFTHNMVTTSICWVSRATLFTGQYVSRHKSYRLKTPEFYKTWQNISWPALLQQHAGYYTGHVGKWQYHNPNGIVERQLFNYTKIFEGRHQYGVRGHTYSAAEKTRQEVQKFLDKRPRDRPWALTAAFYPPKAIGNSFEPGGQWFPLNSTRMAFYGDNVTIPHPPYNETEAYRRLPPFFHRSERIARNRWKERFEGEERYQEGMKNYYSLITEVDTACRGIVKSLEREGILNETLIIFTTDNGLFHSEHGLAGKWYPYQESIRVPLIIRDPRMPPEKRNTLDGSLTLNIDLNPTILGAAGITPPPSVQGENIANLYLPPREESEEDDSDNDDNDASEEEEHEEELLDDHQTGHKASVRWRNEFLYEFPLENGLTMPMSSAVVRKDIKYIYWPQHRYEQLFNLTQDPLELNDVCKEPQYANILEELRGRHAELIEAVK